MLSAKRGILTEEMKRAADSEKLSPSTVLSGIADGSIVLVKNTKRSIEPLLVGSKTRIKINANIGTSSALSDCGGELDKMRMAVKHGADAIMDLSTAGDLGAIRRAILSECPVAVGTVPLYEMAVIAQQKKKIGTRYDGGRNVRSH
jgi:phosphomethylpyrimidine synthase